MGRVRVRVRVRGRGRGRVRVGDAAHGRALEEGIGQHEQTRRLRLREEVVQV
jgi:hypothetical protein